MADAPTKFAAAPVGTTIAVVAQPTPAAEPTTGFVTELHATVVSEPQTLWGRSRWKLLDPLVYQAADIAGWVITVPAGTITDYASVPRLPILYTFFGDTLHMAAVIHDWAYSTQLMSRKMADSILYDAAKASKNPRWRAFIMWMGVRVFAIFVWHRYAKAKATKGPP